MAFNDLVPFVRSQRFYNSLVPRGIPHRAVRVDVVSALPADPQDGDEVYVVADSTTGVVWRFRYRYASSSAYRWEFIGGPPLVASVATSEATTSTSYADLATAGPSVTLPFAGDYDVSFGAALSSAVAEIGFVSFDVGSTAAVDADGVRMGTGGGDQASVSRLVRKTGVAAGDAVTLKYRSFGGGSVSFLDRWVSVSPVRIGG